MAKVNRKRRSYFAPAIRGSARLTSGRDPILERENHTGYLLTNHNFSSLVIDTLCDEASEAEEDIAMAWFYFDFAVQKEQSATSILGAILKQVVSGFKEIPKEISNGFRRHKKAIGGRRLQLPDIVKLLGNLSSTRRTFFCLDALDECAAPDRAKILLSLRDIIKMSPATRVFLTGRPHVGGEVGRHLSGSAALVPISSQTGDIIRYIHKKLAEDTAPDEMDEKLEVEIIKKISAIGSGM